MPKYPEGSVSPSGKYVVRGGKWVPNIGAARSGASQHDPAYKDAVKTVSNERSAYQQYRNQVPLLNDAAAMISGKTTGQPGKVDAGGLINNIPVVRDWAQAVSPDANKFQNLGNRLQIGTTPQGQGAVSDYERRLFAAGAPSLQNFNGVNREIIAQRQALNDEQRDKVAFMEDYLNRNGNLNGAMEVWDAYVAKDPYYAPSAKNPAVKVAKSKDPERWRRFIYGGARIAPPPQSSGPPRKGGGWSITPVN